MKYLYYLFVLLFVSSTSFAQTFKISGILIDSKDRSTLISANISLVSIKDSTAKLIVLTDLDGKFQFSNLKNGGYKLKISYIGYSEKEQFLKIENADKNLGNVLLSQNETTLKDVTIIEKEVRVVQKTDTAEYNSKAFKTNPDATTEDLITKMPGIVNDNGTIKAHGEQVQKVLIDGKEYFGDDASAALKNLPADVVDKVQVFDRMSDQAQFTGFDDGNSQKAMNITTKKGMNNGVFGKVYGGYGYLTDSRYALGANVNWFNGDRRLSFIGMSNNVNQQNFSAQDLLGVTGASSQRQGGPPAGAGGGRGRSGGGGGNNPASNFLVGQSNGISTTHAIGLNYSDVWGKKKNVKVTGSYFFNWAENLNQADLTRKYFNNGDSSVRYHENNNNNSININHRVNFRLQYDIDSMNAFIFTPKITFQQNKQQNNIIGNNAYGDGYQLSKTQSDYNVKNFGYNFSADLLFRHRFKKSGQTISINVTPSVNNKNGTTSQSAINQYYQFNDSSSLDQKATTASTNYGISGSINYTEAVGTNEIIQLTYSPSYSWNKADKETNNRDSASVNYSRLDTILSNKYDNNYMTQKAGMSYRITGKKSNFMVGVTTQYALLTGKEVFPYSFNTSKSFIDILPTAMFNYKFSNTSNLRVMYRTNTNPPSITQLQNVIDNSNPLLLSTGNPDLKQAYSHFIMARYGITNPKTAQSFFAFVSANFIQNYVGNSTFIASHDTALNSLVTLRSGSQLSKPVNLNGNMNVNSFFTYGLPITKIKCNLNLNLGLSYTRTPSQINYDINLSNTYNVNGGFVLSSNISEKIDFTISYFANYNIVKNTLQKKSDNNYFNHNANIKFNWMFWKGFVINTSVQNTLYAGISQGFNQNIFLWNASLGYKFLKDKSLEVKAGVNDILNQNNGISRTITDTYIEDSKTKVLKRYLMLTVTYNLKFFKKPNHIN